MKRVSPEVEKGQVRLAKACTASSGLAYCKHLNTTLCCTHRNPFPRDLENIALNSATSAQFIMEIKCLISFYVLISMHHLHLFSPCRANTFNAVGWSLCTGLLKEVVLSGRKLVQ